MAHSSFFQRSKSHAPTIKLSVHVVNAIDKHVDMYSTHSTLVGPSSSKQIKHLKINDLFLFESKENTRSNTSLSTGHKRLTSIMNIC